MPAVDADALKFGSDSCFPEPHTDRILWSILGEPDSLLFCSRQTCDLGDLPRERGGGKVGVFSLSHLEPQTSLLSYDLEPISTPTHGCYALGMTGSSGQCGIFCPR
jgi:hypothetical protein